MPENKEGKYPKLTFSEEFLDIAFEHDCIATADEVEWHRWVTQQRLSERVGRQIPLEEIYVKPEVGEAYKAVTHFRVGPDTQELYFGLRVLHQKDRLVLPNLLSWLERYDQAQEERQRHLLSSATVGLKRIINPETEG